MDNTVENILIEQNTSENDCLFRTIKEEPLIQRSAGDYHIGLCKC